MKTSCTSVAISRRGFRKWIVLVALIVFNLAASCWAQEPGQNERTPAAQRPDSSGVSLVGGMGFCLLVGAGLIVAGRKRKQRDGKSPFAPMADFEMAFRLQQAPRKSVDGTPLFRDGTMRLRRTASALGCDH